MMASSPRNSVGNVRSDMDIAYPEHLSRLHRHSILAEYPKLYHNPKKNTRNRRGNRYRTQPVTFDEIQEVDEENMVIESQNLDDQGLPISGSLSTSKLDIDFYRFTKALSAKKKKSNAEAKDVNSGNTNNIDQTNGPQSVQGLHKKPDEQHRRTDYAREGSV